MPSDASALVFTRSSGGLYYATPSGGTANRRLAWLPPPAATDLGASLTVEQTWQTGGAYFLLGTSLNSAPVFVGLAQRWLAIPQYAQARVVWLANPNDALSTWQATAVPVADDGGHTVVPSTATVPLRNYGVVFGPGCGASTAADPAAITIAAGNGAATITMTSASGAAQLPVVGGPVRLLLSGPLAGCLTFPVSIPVDDRGTSYLDELDTGLRFFYPDPDIPGGAVASLWYPVFDLAPPGASEIVEDVTLDATVDPLRPLDPDRTQFAFAASSPMLGCYYRTALGRPMTLTPAAEPNPARLLFAVRPRTVNPGGGDPLYLVPDGSFAFAPAPDVPTDPVPRILCGTAGIEYVEAAPAMTLTFVAGQPAYAPAFDPGQEDQPPAAGGTRLTSTATTAWAALTAESDTPSYFAQPHGAPLFQRPPPTSDTVADGTTNFLRYFPVQAGTLPTTAELPPASSAYPLAPYAGTARTDSEALGRYEVQVLSQQRRAIIHTISGQVAPPPPSRAELDAEPTECKAGTPQGLIAEFAASGTDGCDGTKWKQLTLAKSQADTLLTLDSIVDPLRSALLTPQQFLVASSPAAMREHIGVNDRIVIDDWKFVLDTGDWSRHGTIMLIKNVPKTLRELVADPNTWVLASTFNADVAATQSQLQSIIADIPPNDADFRYFRQLVDDANWNGILFLNAYVPLTELPPQLEGLAAGIDPALFKAHHVGINQTALTPDLVQQPSSLFGLINYHKQRPLSAATYDFNVLSLKVLFANSTITDFSSIVQVALNTLFATKVSQLEKPDNVVELNGVYQKHGDHDVYVFSEDRPTTFDAVDDKVLSSVTIQKATFATLVGDDASSTETKTRFAFWGTMAFRELTAGGNGQPSIPYDVFSYDALSFSNLLLNMDFPTAQPTSRAFAFEPAQMAFDPTTSVTREHALARHFPVTIKRLLTASDAGKSAPDLGYMTLTTQLDSTAPASPWYGLEFDLNLGTVGALASKAGLIVSLAVVWSPANFGLPVFVGLKLPFSSGSKNEISIEGIIKISMYARLLLYTDGAFLLKLNGIDLSIFGKTLPPGGSFDFFIFGDPDDNAGATSLGWYGAYKKDKQQDQDENARLAAVRAAPALTAGEPR